MIIDSDEIVLLNEYLTKFKNYAEAMPKKENFEPCVFDYLHVKCENNQWNVNLRYFWEKILESEEVSNKTYRIQTLYPRFCENESVEFGLGFYTRTLEDALVFVNFKVNQYFDKLI